ncbi:MAG: hypothetical protein ACO1N7_12190 [Sphingobacteriaceae bacterium]
MRKRLVLLLLLKLSGLWLHNAIAQSQLSFENYYSMSEGSPLTIMPVASFQGGKGFYAESRYNYEELNTLSLYMGRTFSKESKLSYSISPIAGVVIGQFNGGSVGANISLGYKNFYLYSQPQYTFAVENSANNYIYSWTDITYSPLNWLSLGISLQHTKPNQSEGFLENGFVLEAAYKRFTFPVYVFNPQSKDRSIVFGANFEVNFRKKKSSERKSDPLEDVYPVNILAANAGVEDKKMPEVPTKPAAQNVVRVRRVNVVLTEKAETSAAEKVVKPIAPAKPTIVSHSPVVKKGSPENSVTNEIKVLERPVNARKSSSEMEKTQLLRREAIENKTYTTYFALLLGPYKLKDDAINIQSKLTSIFNRDIKLYTEGAQFKLRIAGFENQKDAEIFSLNATNEGSKAASLIIPYKIKNIEAIPLKGSNKPFEATQIQ